MSSAPAESHQAASRAFDEGGLEARKQRFLMQWIPASAPSNFASSAAPEAQAPRADYSSRGEDAGLNTVRARDEAGPPSGDLWGLHWGESTLSTTVLTPVEDLERIGQNTQGIPEALVLCVDDDVEQALVVKNAFIGSRPKPMVPAVRRSSSMPSLRQPSNVHLMLLVPAAGTNTTSLPIVQNHVRGHHGGLTTGEELDRNRCWPPGSSIDNIQRAATGPRIEQEDAPAPFRKECWSIGAAGHASGTCAPCGWHWKPKGCSMGADCNYCHLCPPGTIGKRRKEKAKAVKKQMKDGVSVASP